MFHLQLFSMMEEAVVNIIAIIPALNEERSIHFVINELRQQKEVDKIIVVNNGSTDQTADVAAKAGAVVVNENRRGYGSACLRGLEFIKEANWQPNIVFFIDADYSDYPQDLPDILNPILDNHADMVIGSRLLGDETRTGLTPQQRVGNWVATRIIKWKWGVTFTDLGPFRAIRYSQLLSINMQDESYGWTVEMQLKAIKHKLRVIEVPVRYRERIGSSKISGTLKGSVLAGFRIMNILLKYG